VLFIFCLLITSLFYLTAPISTACAATYYLDAVNGDDGNPGTSSQPWKTIGRASPESTDDPNVSPDDTVILKDGDYGTWYWKDYNNPTQEWITYQAENTLGAKFDQIQIQSWDEAQSDFYVKVIGVHVDISDMNLAETVAHWNDYRHYSWELKDVNHFVIQECRIEANSTPGVIEATGNGLQINNASGYGGNLTVQGCTITGVDVGLGGLNVRNSTISDCNIYGCSKDAIQIGGCKNLIIEGCQLHDISNSYDRILDDFNVPSNLEDFQSGESISQPDTGAQGTVNYIINDAMYVTEANGTFSANHEVYGDGDAVCLPTYTYTTHRDLVQLYSGTIYKVENTTIRRNKLWNCGQGLFLKNVYNGLIENNLVYGNLDNHHCTLHTNCDSAIVRNNTFDVNNTQPDILIYSNNENAAFEIHNNICTNSLFFGTWSGTWGNSAILKNNILGSCGNCDLDGVDLDASNYVYGHVVTDEEEAAIFADPAGGDYSLKSNSLAIGFADPNNSPISDILGVSRVFPLTIAPPDAGCYEFPVDPNNQAPVLQEIGDKSVNENSVLIFGVTATDADGDTITYSIQNKPSGATFVNQTFTWTPGYNQAETYTVTFIASDGQAQDSETITITVNNVNRAPELNTIGDQSVNENSTLSFSVSASDADGDTISYSLNTLPGGAVFGSETFTWTPGYDQAETYTLTFIASDGQAQDSETITITVNNVNRKPVLADIGNQSVYTTRALSFAVSAGDPDGDAIDYSASGTPSGASFTNQTFSWTPDAGQNGTYQVTFAASDGQLQDSETITIEVGADDSSPVVANCSPTDAAAQVPLNNLIILHILDDNSGVDVNSVTIKVNDDVVYTGNTTDYSSAWGHCRRTGTIADFTFVYQPDQMFDFDQAINVTVNAADICGNAMVEHSHSFETEMFSFGENKNINADGLSKNHPATVQDSGGNIWAAWHAGATGSRDIYIAKLAAGAGSFAGSIRLTNGAADQCNPAVAIDADDKLYVVWQDNTQGNWDILIRTSADGAAWSAERTVTDSNGNQTNPAIVVDGSLSRNVSVAWQDDRAGNADIYVAVSGNDFVTKTTSQITSHTANQYEPAITADASNTIYVVWTDQRNGSNDIYYGASSSIGPWTEVAVVTKSNSQSSPAIAAEQTGSILHLLWVDDISGDSDIYYASSDGLPGSPLTGAGIVDDTTGADQSQPAIVVTGTTGSSLKVFASWKDERNVSSNGDSDLYLVQIGSDENVFVGDDGTNSNQSKPALGVDAYGYPYLLWADSRTASPSIYYAGTTFVQSAALASNDVSASSGATVGADPVAISSADDVSVIVPAGACCSDLKITISKVENPPKFNLQQLSVPYDFGPSGIEFSQPVTITIPYTVPADGQYASAYWYNPLTGTLSQQGITNVSSTQISPTLYALSFKTTHFSQFIVGGGTVGSDGVSGGGGCSMSPSGQADLKEYLLPYIALAAVMLVLKLRDARRRRLQSTIRGGR